MNYSIQIADQTFIAAPVSCVVSIIDSLGWEEQWPGLSIELTQDRKELGKRWKISGPIEGTMEVWLPPHLDGVLLHYFVHANPANHAAKTHAVVPPSIARENPSGYRFVWDLHGVRRNARRIALMVKQQAQLGKLPGLAHPASAPQSGK